VYTWRLSDEGPEDSLKDAQLLSLLHSSQYPVVQVAVGSRPAEEGESLFVAASDTVGVVRTHTGLLTGEADAGQPLELINEASFAAIVASCVFQPRTNVNTPLSLLVGALDRTLKVYSEDVFDRASVQPPVSTLPLVSAEENNEQESFAPTPPVRRRISLSAYLSNEQDEEDDEETSIEQEAECLGRESGSQGLRESIDVEPRRLPPPRPFGVVSSASSTSVTLGRMQTGGKESRLADSPHEADKKPILSAALKAKTSSAVSRVPKKISASSKTSSTMKPTVQPEGIDVLYPSSSLAHTSTLSSELLRSRANQLAARLQSDEEVSVSTAHTNPSERVTAATRAVSSRARTRRYEGLQAVGEAQVLEHMPVPPMIGKQVDEGWVQRRRQDPPPKEHTDIFNTNFPVVHVTLQTGSADQQSRPPSGIRISFDRESLQPRCTRDLYARDVFGDVDDIAALCAAEGERRFERLMKDYSSAIDCTFRL
jgi:hypothetical protein